MNTAQRAPHVSQRNRVAKLHVIAVDLLATTLLTRLPSVELRLSTTAREDVKSIAHNLLYIIFALLRTRYGADTDCALGCSTRALRRSEGQAVQRERSAGADKMHRPPVPRTDGCRARKQSRSALTALECAHTARCMAPPLACATSASSSRPAVENAAASVSGAEAPADDEAEAEAQIFSSLVKHEAIVPTPSVRIPQWMAESYTAMRDFWRRAGRLFLPETSVRTKLPYYAYASLHSAMLCRPSAIKPRPADPAYLCSSSSTKCYLCVTTALYAACWFIGSSHV